MFDRFSKTERDVAQIQNLMIDTYRSGTRSPTPERPPLGQPGLESPIGDQVATRAGGRTGPRPEEQDDS